MKIMASHMTLGELERENTKPSYKGRYGESLVKNPNIGSHFYCNISIIIGYRITKIDATPL